MRTNLLLLASMATLACQGTSVISEGDISAAVRGIPEARLQKLAQKRIYFGHQSVGYNVVEGLQAIAKERPGSGLQIAGSRTPPAALPGAGLTHALNGRNHEPLSKIQQFASTIEGGVGATADLALFKFCYVDFPPGTDVEKVFAEYRSTMARLRQAFPGVRFVHVTSPLTVVQSGPKAWVKRVLGKPLGGVAENVSRERFNALMRKEYAGREPVFDLAAVESRLPDGRTVSFQDGGTSYPALAEAYASDGKHLNDLGARWVATHFIEALATAAD